MPLSRRVGLAVAITGSAVATTVLPFTAHAESTVLHVDNRATVCSDKGTGTQALPFCTIQAAADVAEPGQTVDIAANRQFTGQVTVKRSGQPGKPIVFRGDVSYGAPSSSVDASSQGSTGPHAFVLDGVHDVTVSGLSFDAPQEAVLVKDSTRIALDRSDASNSGNSFAPGATANIRVTGASSNVTVSRNRVFSPPVAGVAIDAGVTGAVVTTNIIADGPGRGVLVTDAPGTVVVSNTIAANCGNDLELAGNSAGATVENNILTKRPAPACNNTPAPAPTAVSLAVSAGSVQGTKADYNTVVPRSETSASYSWGGTSYATPQDFRATGQGAHDNAADPGFADATYEPVAAEGLTDAADPTALGVLATDFYDKEPADHPGIANTAPSGYRDRGAIERQDPLYVSVYGFPFTLEGRPFNARFKADYVRSWSPGTATLDFGDGSAPLTIQSDQFVDHDYPAAGSYTATLTGTSLTGPSRTSTVQVTIAQLPELWTQFSWSFNDRSRAQITVSAESVSPWPVVRHVVDFGDGTAPAVSEGPSRTASLTHEYGVGGSYTITETVTDNHGRTASRTRTVGVPGPQAGVPFTGYFGGPTSHNGLFDNGVWTLSYNKTDSRPNSVWGFGNPGDIPVVGNWDYTCQCQHAIYRPSTAAFDLSRRDGSISHVPFGNPGDLPAVGSWDRNGHDQVAVYRPSTATLWIRHDDGSYTPLHFGNPGDQPVVGDWDGVGHSQFGVYRPAANPWEPNLFIFRHDDGSYSTVTYGNHGDLPVVGDWSGVGRASFGIYRPATHQFTLNNSYAGRPDNVYTIYNNYN
ncbi:PKD domain-containing protein [Kitasatospora sp. NPDC056184]|uniref:right-handed parallel beta-helix repeat-containing protein n=1 Tax=Kitasatospora sp. NPDC056184 TaxID=3345738 RepID=UPI0035DF0BF8